MRLLLLAQSARAADLLPYALFVLILARTLGPGPYGEYAFWFNAAFLCSSLLPPSLPDILGRLLPASPSSGRRVIRRTALTRVIFSILGAAVLVVLWIATRESWPIEVGLAALACYGSLETLGFSQAAASGTLAFDVLLRWRVAGRATTLGLGVVLLALGALNVAGALVVVAAGNLLTSAGVMRGVWRRIGADAEPRQGDQHGIANVRRFGVQTWIASVLTIGLGTQKDVVLLGLLGAAPSVVGIYSVAATLVTQIQILLVGGWTSTTLPVLARSDRPSGAFARRWGTYAALWVSLMTPAFLALAIGAPDLLPLLFGAAFAAAAGPVIVTSIGNAVTGPLGGPANQSALYGLNRGGLVLMARAIALSINVALALILIPTLGAIGAAGATVSAVVIVFAIELVLLRRIEHVRIPVAVVTRVVVASGGLAAVATAVGLATSMWLAAAALYAVAIALVAHQSGYTRPARLRAALDDVRP